MAVSVSVSYLFRAQIFVSVCGIQSQSEHDLNWNPPPPPSLFRSHFKSLTVIIFVCTCLQHLNQHLAFCLEQKIHVFIPENVFMFGYIPALY